MFRPDRRALLAGGTAAVLGGCATTPKPTSGSLKALAAAKGITFGSAAGTGRPGALTASFEDPAYRALLVEDCAAIVPENELKFGWTRHTPDGLDFSAADRLAEFAARQDMKLRGHCLIWHHPQWFPEWINTYDFGPRPAEAAERMVVEHIQTVTARYPQIGSWDVINETVDAETGALRDTPLSRAMGQSVLDVAFHAAREAMPTTELVYNDYMSWEAGHEAHRAGVLRLLEGFKARGVPCDALGVQSHIGSGNSDGSVGFDTAQETQWRRFLDEVTGMGYRLLVTEFDVHDKNLPADLPSRDLAVADLGRRYLDLMLSYPQLDTVMCWGMADRYSWLQNMWLRQDRLPKRPTPYDAEFRPKPLHAAIADAFRAADPR